MNIEKATMQQTISGQILNYNRPESYNYTAWEIAYILARTPRFGGHTSRYYSVAAHSMYVAHHLPSKLRLHGILHDAHEAFIGDIPTPLANYLDREKINHLKTEIQVAIYRSFDLAPPTTEELEVIKRCDVNTLFVEKRDLLLHDLEWSHSTDIPDGYDPMLPAKSLSMRNDCANFLRSLKEYYKQSYPVPVNLPDWLMERNEVIKTN